MSSDPLVFTVGHGNRTREEFVALLHQAGITLLLDVRRYPGSRRHPHFAREALEHALPVVGIAYRWEGERLGGRRREGVDSPHTALRSASFRAYADHMRTPLFRAAYRRYPRRRRRPAGDPVRRKPPLALPPLVHRRRPPDCRRPGHPSHRPGHAARAFPFSFRPGGGGGADLRPQ